MRGLLVVVLLPVLAAIVLGGFCVLVVQPERISEMGGVEGIAARLPGPLGGVLRWLRDRGVLDGSGGGGKIAGYAAQILQDQIKQLQPK